MFAFAASGSLFRILASLWLVVLPRIGILGRLLAGDKTELSLKYNASRCKNAKESYI